jgi:hypothetical protein
MYNINFLRAYISRPFFFYPNPLKGNFGVTIKNEKIIMNTEMINTVLRAWGQFKNCGAEKRKAL